MYLENHILLNLYGRSGETHMNAESPGGGRHAVLSVRRLGLLVFVMVHASVFPGTGSSFASTTEPIPIRTLLDGATSYQGHSVTVSGVAKEIEKWPPVPAGKCGILYDSYIFTVEDESGSIRVEVFGTCHVQGVVELAQDGDRVLVEGVLFQPLSSYSHAPVPWIYTHARAIRRLLP